MDKIKTPVRYFVIAHIPCDRCNGTKEILNTGLKAIEWPGSKTGCGHCKGCGYISKEVEIDPANMILRKANMNYTFDEKSGHICDADGIAIAYSHVTEWGQEITTTLNTVADQSRVIEDVMPARKALDRQQQLDESGVMVGVSRQAVDEVCAFIDALAEAQRIMEGEVDAKYARRSLS